MTSSVSIVETTSPPLTVAGRDYEPGDCVLYDAASEDVTAPSIVECSQPHVFEYVGTIDLSGADYPGRRALRDQLDERCPPLIVERFGAELDPAGLYGIEGLAPTAGSWSSGDRDGHCGIGLRPATEGDVSLKVGAFAELDERRLMVVGTCGSSDGLRSCDGPHAWQYIGQIDLTGLVSTPSDHGALADELCAPLADDYLGEPLAAGLVLSIFDVVASSWDRGSRRTECGILSIDIETGEIVDGIARPLRRADVPAAPGQCLDDRQAIIDCNRPHDAQVTAIATTGTDCIDEATRYLGAGRPTGFEISAVRSDSLCLLRRAGGGSLPAGSLQALQAGPPRQPGLVEAAREPNAGSNARIEPSVRQPSQTPVP